MRYPLSARTNDLRLKRPPRFLLREISAPLRSQPSFFIVGAMKSGTSSLYSYLCQHPRIVAAYRKEVHYFDLGLREGRGERWFRAHFPRKKRHQKDFLTGEATPDYIFCPDGPQLIAQRYPKARLLVLLRDPVERAVSHYFHEVRMGRETLPIELAMEVEEERMQAANESGDLETYLHASYKKRGVYVEQIRSLLAHFPREQILIQGSGTLFRTPDRAVQEALAFLGLPLPKQPLSFPVKNIGANRSDVPAKVYQSLKHYFEPYNQELFDFLGEQIDW